MATGRNAPTRVRGRSVQQQGTIFKRRSRLFHPGVFYLAYAVASLLAAAASTVAAGFRWGGAQLPLLLLLLVAALRFRRLGYRRPLFGAAAAACGALVLGIILEEQYGLAARWIATVQLVLGGHMALQAVRETAVQSQPV